MATQAIRLATILLALCECYFSTNSSPRVRVVGGLLTYARTYFFPEASLTGISHTFVCFLSPPQASMIPFRGPKAPTPTRLMAHIYGTKNLYTVMIRVATAYTMPDSVELYCLCWLTFFGVFTLYSTESLLYRTVRPKEATIPLLTSGLGMIWMWLEKDFYCEKVRNGL